MVFIPLLETEESLSNQWPPQAPKLCPPKHHPSDVRKW